MTVLLVIFMILIALAVDSAHQKVKTGSWAIVPQLPDPKMFNDPRLGLTMADGGEQLPYRATATEKLTYIQRKHENTYVTIGAVNGSAAPSEITTILNSLNQQQK
jgi:hypothetical protein